MSIFFCTGAREWDALHLYIANNLDWMTVWIEQCQHSGRTLTWKGVSSLVKEAHRNGDSNVMPMVIDLAYGLRGRKVHISLFVMTHIFNIKSQMDANNFDMFEKLQVKNHKAM